MVLFSWPFVTATLAPRDSDDRQEGIQTEVLPLGTLQAQPRVGQQRHDSRSQQPNKRGRQGTLILRFLAAKKSETLQPMNTLLWIVRGMDHPACPSLDSYLVFQTFCDARRRQRDGVEGKRKITEAMVVVKIANQELSITSYFNTHAFHLPLCSFSSPSSCSCPSLHSSGVWWPKGYSGSGAKQKYVLNTWVGIVPPSPTPVALHLRQSSSPHVFFLTYLILCIFFRKFLLVCCQLIYRDKTILCYCYCFAEFLM